MNFDINTILDKYLKGESTLEEEKFLQDYMLSDDLDEEHQDIARLFGYYASERSIGQDFQPDLSFAKNKPGKLRVMFPRIIAVAASLVILLTVANMWFGSDTDTIYKNKFTEIEDPREGLDITLKTLGFASNTLDDAIQPVSHIKELQSALQPISHLKQLEKTSVFNFDK